MIRMAVESWCFARSLKRQLLKIDIGEQNRYSRQFLWLIKKVEETIEQAD